MIDKRIFDNIEEINELYGVELSLPENIPDGSNILAYRIEGLYEVYFEDFYKEDDELYFYNYCRKEWLSTYNVNLYDEVSNDEQNGYDYIYLRLKPFQEVNEDKIKFTPERLLGVETK